MPDTEFETMDEGDVAQLAAQMSDDTLCDEMDIKIIDDGD